MSLFNHLSYCSCLAVGAFSAVALSFGAPLFVGVVGLVACLFVIIANNKE